VAQGVHREIHDQADGVARRGRAEDRQDVVVALTQPVDMHGLAEIRLGGGKSDGGGRVEEAANADGGIDREAQRVLGRVTDAQLQQIVQHVAGLVEVGREIADAPGAPVRQDVP
jgi:hypothetical protein